MSIIQDGLDEEEEHFQLNLFLDNGDKIIQTEIISILACREGGKSFRLHVGISSSWRATLSYSMQIYSSEVVPGGCFLSWSFVRILETGLLFVMGWTCGQLKMLLLHVDRLKCIQVISYLVEVFFFSVTSSLSSA